MGAKAQTGSWQPCDALGNVHDCYGWFDPYYSISGSCTVGGDPAYALPAPGEFSKFTAPFDELELSETAPDLPDVASISVSATQDAVGYFAWVDGSGNPAPNPPSQALFQISLNPGAYIFAWQLTSLSSGTITDDYPGDTFKYDDSNPFDGNLPNETFTHLYVANVTNGIAKIDVKSHYNCVLTPSQPFNPTMSAYAYDGLDAEPTTYNLAIGAGTSAKVLAKDPGPATDGNPAWPNVADQYGNLQYMPGPEPDGSAGQYLGDIGIPSYIRTLERQRRR